MTGLAMRAKDSRCPLVDAEDRGDLISRADAIDAISKIKRTDNWQAAVSMALLDLPSAQPEQSTAQERYEDLCEYFKDCSDQGRSILTDRKEFKSWLDRMKWHVMECDKLGRELEKLKSAQPDLSEYSDKLWRNAYERGKRDAQADFDMTEKIDKAYDDGYKQGYLQGKADYERKTGKWVTVHGYCTPGGDPVWACSECGKGIHVYGIEHGSYGRDVSDGQWKACPNCGCRMLKEGEEHD